MDTTRFQTRLQPALILPNMFSHCLTCNAVLMINEEWHTGRCVECAQWADVLRLVDIVIDMPIKRRRAMNRDS